MASLKSLLQETPQSRRVLRRGMFLHDRVFALSNSLTLRSKANDSEIPRILRTWRLCCNLSSILGMSWAGGQRRCLPSWTSCKVGGVKFYLLRKTKTKLRCGTQFHRSLLELLMRLLIRSKTTLPQCRRIVWSFPATHFWCPSLRVFKSSSHFVSRTLRSGTSTTHLLQPSISESSSMCFPLWRGLTQ